MDTRILERAGFTDGEARVYIALLGLGATSSGSIITRSGVSRSKVYEVLGRLKKKGMATEINAGGTRHFVPSSPSRVLDYLSQKEREFSERKSELEHALPSLIALQKSSDDQGEARVYSGFEGIRSLYESELARLSRGDEYLEFMLSDREIPDARLLRFLSRFHKIRAGKKASARVLSADGALLAQRYLDFSSSPSFEFRVSPPIFPCSLAIFPSTVVMFDFGENPRAFAFVSKRNADRYRRFFLSGWKNARRKVAR